MRPIGAIAAALVLTGSLTAGVAVAGDRPVEPDVSLRSLAMDPLDMYEDYEALWSEANPATTADVARWRELLESLDAHTPDGVERKCGYTMWTAKNDNPWREEMYSPWDATTWKLGTVGGVEPDAKSRKSYTKDKEKAAKKEAKKRRRADRKGEMYDPPFHPASAARMLQQFPDPDVVMQREGGTRFFGFRPDPTGEGWHRGVQYTVGIDRAGRVESMTSVRSNLFPAAEACGSTGSTGVCSSATRRSRVCPS